MNKKKWSKILLFLFPVLIYSFFVLMHNIENITNPVYDLIVAVNFSLIFAFLILFPIYFWSEIVNFLKTYYKKIYKVFIILIIVLVAYIFISIVVDYYRQKQKEKSIINYCESVKWRIYNNENDYYFFAKLILNDEVTCGDFLYLKPKVKKSTAEICHDENGTYYYKTKEYKIFDSMKDCINSGGRRPYN